MRLVRATLFVILRKENLIMLSIFFILTLCIYTLRGLSTKVPEKPLSNRIIAVDPGHGGMDSGSSHSGYYEKDLTLDLALVLAKQLEAAGATVILTRTTDTDLIDLVTIEEEIRITKEEYQKKLEEGTRINALDKGIALGTRTPPLYRLGLRARLLIAYQHNADILVSIHTNHFRSSSSKGAVTLYYQSSEKSKLLAERIQDHLGPLRPGRSHPDEVADDFFILRVSQIPAVILEVGFISNKDDREFMLSDQGSKEIAEAIIQGIINYFSESDQ